MENIILTETTDWETFINEILEKNPIMNSLSFKFNKCDIISAGDLQDVVENLIFYVSANMEHNVDRKLYATLGEHNLGKNEKPHYHLNILAPAYISGNESRRRKKWSAENEVVLPPVTMKEGLINDSKQALDCLAYPLKEDIKININSRYVKHIPDNHLLMMQQYAKALFAEKQQRDRAKARASDRVKNLLSGLEGLCHEQTFSNYGEFKSYIYDAFYTGLELEEYPEFKNLQSCVQKIAIKRKIVTAAFFDKY